MLRLLQDLLHNNTRRTEELEDQFHHYSTTETNRWDKFEARKKWIDSQEALRNKELKKNTEKLANLERNFTEEQDRWNNILQKHLKDQKESASKFQDKVQQQNNILTSLRENLAQVEKQQVLFEASRLLEALARQQSNQDDELARLDEFYKISARKKNSTLTLQALLDAVAEQERILVNY